MKRLPVLLSLLLASLLTACGGSEPSEMPKKDFLDSIYRPASYRATLDSIRVNGNLKAEELDQFKAYMRANGDHIGAKWTYRDIHRNAQGYAGTMEAPLGLSINGITPRTDQKIVEFRFELDFKNQTNLPVRRFHAQLVWLDEQGEELDRSPRFAVNQSLAPKASTGELRLQYAYYRPTGNEMNQPKNEEQRRKVDEMLKIAKAKTIDMKHYRLEVSDLLLDNGKSAREYWQMDPQEQAALPATAAWPKQSPLLSWAEKNKDWVKKLQDPVGTYFLMVTPILTDKYEATHGSYLLFDRIEKFTGFFTGQQHIPSEKIISAPSGKMVVNEVLDFWNWPMELRIYEL